MGDLVFFIPLSPQIFPELPVPKAGENVDKVQQYTDDFAETKKRLEEARQRRLDEKRKQEGGCLCHALPIFSCPRRTNVANVHCLTLRMALQMAKKLQRSMSKENAAETAAAMVEAERDRRNRKSATPPKQREDKTPSGKQRTPTQGKSAAAAAKKKLTMEDLEDDAGSDADWSDVETPNRSKEFSYSITLYLL